MYKHILIATDGSELATKGLTQGLELAKALAASVTIVTVTEMWSALEIAREARSGDRHPVEEYEAAAAASASRVLSAAVKVAEAHGMAVDTVHVSDQNPAEGILAAAAKGGCDLIVIASHGRRGIRRLILGSIAMEVVTHSTIPTLVVR